MASLSRRAARWVANFLQAEDGPTAVEYAVVLALIIVACLAAIISFGQDTNSTFSSSARR